MAAVGLVLSPACSPEPGSLGHDTPDVLAQGYGGDGGEIDDDTDPLSPGFGESVPDLGVPEHACEGGEFEWVEIPATEDLFLLAQKQFGTCLVDHQQVDFWGTPYVPCEDVNTGALPRLWVDFGLERESHYLARFDFSGLNPAFVDRATLVVHAEHEGPVDLVVQELDDTYSDWNPGTGLGTRADPGEASFGWYAYPTSRWFDEDTGGHVAALILSETLEWEDDAFSVELDPDWAFAQTKLSGAHPGLLFTALASGPFNLRWQAVESGNGPYIRLRYCSIDIAAP